MNKKKNISFAELYPLIQDAIGEGKNISFTAFGSSMSPFIQGGCDRVVLSPLYNAPKKGDIIFYRRRNGNFALHRIVKSCGNEYFLCGDHQYTLERGIKQEHIVAILSEIQRTNSSLFDRPFFAKAWCFFLPLRRFVLHIFSFFKRVFHS